MGLRDMSYFVEVVNAVNRLQTLLQEVDEDSFVTDITQRAAVVQQIRVLGDSTQRFSEDYKASRPEIPWKRMEAIRDLLILGGTKADPKEMWAVIQEYIPEIVRRVATAQQRRKP